MFFETIKDYYLKGYYTDAQLDIFLQAKWINETEYQQILDAKNQPGPEPETPI